MRGKILAVLAITLLLLGALIIAAQKTPETGKFAFFIKSEAAGEETFTIQQLDNGNQLLTSNFVAKSQELIVQFETDKLFKQEILVDKDWKLLSYSLESDTVRGKLKSTVKVEGNIAKVTLNYKKADGKEENAAREVILEDEFVTTGISATQLVIMQKIVTARMKENKKTYLALDPTNLEKPLTEVTVERLAPVKVKSGSDVKDAQRYGLKIEGEDFSLFLISHADGTLWGVTGESSTSKFLAYRADLFPKGFELAGP